MFNISVNLNTAHLIYAILSSISSEILHSISNRLLSIRYRGYVKLLSVVGVLFYFGERSAQKNETKICKIAWDFDQMATFPREQSWFYRKWIAMVHHLHPTSYFTFIHLQFVLCFYIEKRKKNYGDIYDKLMDFTQHIYLPWQPKLCVYNCVHGFSMCIFMLACIFFKCKCMCVVCDVHAFERTLYEDSYSVQCNVKCNESLNHH